MTARKVLVLVAVGLLIMGIPGSVAASINEYARPFDPFAAEGEAGSDPTSLANGIIIGSEPGIGASYGLYLCYRNSSDYYGLMFFFDDTGDGSMVLDGRGSCLEDYSTYPETLPGLDTGNRIGPMMLWSGESETSSSYKYMIRPDGTLQSLNGNRNIGSEGGMAHFRNPTLYAEDIRHAPYGQNSISLVEQLAVLEQRIADLEAQLSP